MAVFRDSEQFYETVGALMDLAKKDSKIGPKIATAGVVIQFRYTDPAAVTTVNAKDKPTQPDAYCDVVHGACELKPEITLSMKADVAHAFWQGKVNLLGAIAETRHRCPGPAPEGSEAPPGGRAAVQSLSHPVARKGLGNLVMK